MKSGIVASCQQKQQVKTSDFTPLADVILIEGIGGELVEGEELLEVAREGIGLVKTDGEEGTSF